MSDLEAALEAGRAESEGLMRSTIRLYRPGADIFDRETGLTVPGPPTVVFYDGKARVKPAQLADSEVQASEQQVTLRQYRVSIPFSTPLPASGERPRPGDIVDVTDSPDPRIAAGLRLWVKGVEYGDTATAWRLITEDRS
ncbi:DUF6093 family protein [Streptomyces vilmorinianum]|uniref:DUF6093 family protein n=1 Tax=Streptomyces vilmorinianum TaxID=3051092 RepID=UPI0010FAE48D|nr:DUF6093 family protein [Streptomyces vilmorinianum]